MNTADVASLFYQELLKVVGGAAVVLAALSAFLGRVWIARIANKESQAREEAVTGLKSQLERQGAEHKAELDRKAAELKAELDRQATELKAKVDVAVQRTVLVDKLQFEHEYDIYRKAWEHLFALRQATLQLRPMLDYMDPSESKEDRMRKRIGNVKEPFAEFSRLIEINKPFYPEKVYESLVAVRSKCHEEVIAYEYTERSHKEYWSEARKNQEAILALIEEACVAIRNRVAEVRVA